jgi:nitrogen fixation NifU-like protein
MASEDLQEMYQEIILDLAQENNAKISEENFAEKSKNETYIVSKQFNPSCGDKASLAIKFQNKTKPQNQVYLHNKTELQSSFNDKNCFVKDFFWTGVGCNISMASANFIGDWIFEKNLIEIKKTYKLFLKLMNSRGQELNSTEMNELNDLSSFIGVAKFPARIKCALLAWEAVRDIYLKI